MNRQDGLGVNRQDGKLEVVTVTGVARTWPSFKSFFEWLSVTGAAHEARRARRHRIRAARRARINRRGWA